MATWAQLRTHDDWSAKLDELLAAGLDALAGNGSLGTAKTNLIKFIDKSPDRMAGDLDDIADDARRAISKAQIDDALASIAERTAELKFLRKQIAGIAQDAQDSASAMRLERSREVVTSTTHVLGQLRALKEAVEAEGLDPGLVDHIDDTVAAMKELRDTLEDE